MKKLLPVLLLCLYAGATQAQTDLKKKAAQIMAEARQLYRSEAASWNGSDILMARYAALRQQMGGYFSYIDGDRTRCIFFTRGEAPEVLLSVDFDSTFSPDAAMISDALRPLSPLELQAYRLRKATTDLLQRDTFFRGYANGNLNIIPMPGKGGEHKVYLLTGTNLSDEVIFGNDYLITFDGQYQVKSRKRLHSSLLQMPLKTEGEGTGSNTIGGIHTHIPEYDPFITVTDLCTLMLYRNITKWESYVVISDKYVSIWSGKGGSDLVIMTRAAWDKIGADQR